MIQSAWLGDSANSSTSPDVNTVTLEKKNTSFVRSVIGARTSSTGRRCRAPSWREQRPQHVAQQQRLVQRHREQQQPARAQQPARRPGVEAAQLAPDQHDRADGKRARQRLVARQPIRAGPAPHETRRPRRDLAAPARARPGVRTAISK